VIRRAFRVLLVLWAGSLWSLALWVAPTLFYAQPDRHVAGVLATRLFSIETYVGIGVAVLAALLPLRKRFIGGYAAVTLLAVNEWVLKGVMTVAHSRGSLAGLSFGAWHGISALLYLGACIIMMVVVFKEEF
jgi:Domain of unknown function (DUF4149)